MTAEVVISEEAQVGGGEVAVSQPEVAKKLVVKEDHVEVIEEHVESEAKDEKGEEVATEAEGKIVVKHASFKEESNLPSDLREHERKALSQLGAKVEKAILENRLLKNEEEGGKTEEEGNPEMEKTVEEEEKAEAVEEGEKKDDRPEVAAREGEEKDEKTEVAAREGEQKEEKTEITAKEGEKTDEKVEIAAKEGEKKGEEVEITAKEEKGKDGKTEVAVKEGEEQVKSDLVVEGKAPPSEEKPVGTIAEKEGTPDDAATQENEKTDTEEKKVAEEDEKTEEAAEIDRDISLWGVPLLPSKGSECTDAILLKFLRAREFKVGEAFEMLQNTLSWRKKNNIDSISEEEFDPDLNSVAFMNGVDRDGHPICYNIYGVFGNQQLYQKTFGTEEKRDQFLRWRFQMMEKGIEKLDFMPGGTSSMLQITDLKNTPGLTKKELRIATKKAVSLLQDHYPEFVARNIFINVPFWYYAFNAVISPFLTQRTKSKFVFARPSRVTETLLKYIRPEQIPTHYGGFKRPDDTEFSDGEYEVSEVVLRGGSTETIELPASEAGTTLLWELSVVGWEVSYREEFVPTDESSYTTIIKKGKKFGTHEEAVRNSFRTKEPGNVVLTIENSSSYKKKRVLYRYKVKSI